NRIWNDIDNNLSGSGSLTILRDKPNVDWTVSGAGGHELPLLAAGAGYGIKCAVRRRKSCLRADVGETAERIFGEQGDPQLFASFDFERRGCFEGRPGLQLPEFVHRGAVGGEFLNDLFVEGESFGEFFGSK